MITFVTVAASVGAPRSFGLDVLGTAESIEAVQSFFDAHSKRSAESLLAVVHTASDEPTTWGKHIRATTPRPVEYVSASASLTPGHVYVVPPGSVLRLKNGGLLLEHQEAGTAGLSMSPLLQTSIEGETVPVRIMVSKNGQAERPGRPSLSPFEDIRPLRSRPESDEAKEERGQEHLEEEEAVTGSVDERLRKTKAVLRKRTRQVRRLSRALIHAKEDERHRIREVLHDDLQQLLFAARMNLQNLQERALLRSSHEALVSRVEELLSDGLQLTRGLSSLLTPPDEEKSLLSQFEWLAIRMQEVFELQVAVISRGQPQLPHRDHRLFLYRLVQELLFNIVKHAGVTEATLRVVQEDTAIRIEVEEEGNGGVPSEDVTSGSGLDNVIDQIEMMGGTVSLSSVSGTGTRVTIVYPHPGK